MAITTGTTTLELLQIVRELGSATCAKIMEKYKLDSRKKLEFSIANSHLQILVRKGILKYSDEKGPNKGLIYMIGDTKPNIKCKLNFNFKTNQ